MRIASGETRIGWVGLGVMGAPMCGHLLGAGYSATVHTRTRAKAEPLLARGAVWADAPRAVAEASDVIFAMVYDPMEAELPSAGPLTISDADRQLMFDSSSSSLRGRYRADFEARLSTLTGLSRKRSIPLLPISTASPVAEQVRALLGTQQRGRRV